MKPIDDTKRPVLQNRQRPERWYQWLRWGDYLLYILIGVLAGALLLAGMRSADLQGVSAVLSVDGQTVLTITAKQLAAGGSKELTSHGYHYQIIWENGRVRFLEADCPDQVCVQSGWLDKAGQIAACVPGQLILKMVGGDQTDSSSTSDVDVVVK